MASREGGAFDLRRRLGTYSAAVRYFSAILLLVVFGATGSGALSRLHDLAHARQDARHGDCHHEQAPTHEQLPSHDETNCDLHALLRAPVMAGTTVPVLIGLGLFVACLTQLSPAPYAERVPGRIDCRGPPVL